MARDGTARVAGVSVSAAQDFFEYQPADDKPVQFRGAEYGQSSDLGDAAEEVLRTAIRRGDTVSGSGGSTPSALASDTGDTAPGASVEANNTTKANTSGVVLQSTAFNIRIAPTPWWFPDNFAPLAKQGNTTMCWELVAAPADAVTLDQTVYAREF